MGSAHLRAVKAARQKQNVLQNKEKVLWLNAEKKLAEQKVTERPKEKLAEEAEKALAKLAADASLALKLEQ